MSTNVKEFNAFMRAAAEEIEGPKLVTFQKKVALDTFSRIAQKTPVDTGLAAGNWQLHIETPNYDILPLRSAGERDVAALTQLAKMFPFAITYLNNNTEYISYLEDGYSKKAAHGMVAITLLEMQQIREA